VTPWAGVPPGGRDRGLSPRDPRRGQSLSQLSFGSLSHSASIERSFGSPASIGELFLTDHLIAFEVTSIVLLVAAVGGVVLGSHARGRAVEAAEFRTTRLAEVEDTETARA
jgi:hypothetical protein